MSKSLPLACLALLACAATGAEPPLHDPMQPYRAIPGEGRGPGAAPAPRFSLTAVLIAPSRRVAIVNGKPYQEGQRVHGAEITRIDASSIQLRDGAEELVVHLGNARRPSAASAGESDR